MVSDQLSFLLIDISSSIENTGGIFQYILVFLFAAFPLIEILVVIPVAIGIGLNPVTTGIVAFAGNLGSVYLLLLFHQRIARWRARRRDGTEDTEEESRRYQWAYRIWDRYGLPGLSLAAPVLTGVHLAVLLALAAGSSTRTVGWWMTIGIAIWTVALVGSSVIGISLLGIA